MRDRQRITPEDRAELRRWLRAHHAESDGAWVQFPKKHSGITGPSYEDIVEECLCFGWIDSVVHPVPEPGMTSIHVSPRKAGSIWAKSNKARVERLRSARRMTPAGEAVIERAKADGSWMLLDDVEAHVIAPDLAAALAALPGARRRFSAWPASVQERCLYWCYSAKRPTTRAQRIDVVATAADAGTPPAQIG